MRRDFTLDNYEYFCQMVNSVKDSDWFAITDWFGDRYYDVKHWFGKLGLSNYMENLEKYHREVIDKENTSIDKITEIFEEISSVDNKYGAKSAGSYGECSNILFQYRRYIQTLTQISVNAQNAKNNGGKISDYFNADTIYSIMQQVSTELDSVLTEIAFTADTFSNLSEQYKDDYVQMYESSHPDEAKTIDKVLSDPDFTDEEKRDIKFLIYRAPEPYKSIYLQHIKDYKVDLYTPSGERSGSYYSPNENRIYLTDDNETLTGNPRGPYNTFFHESGHAIDDFEKTAGDITGKFEYNGKSLNECITEDVRNYVDNHIDNNYPELTEKQKDEIMRSLNLTDDATYGYEGNETGLDKKLQAYRNEIVDYMSEDLRGEVNEAASDVYGGVTNNAIVGSYGHRSDSNDSTYTYWYTNGNPTGAQESELWAEFFAAKMTNDQKALESIREHFPNAYKAMEAMAIEMVQT